MKYKVLPGLLLALLMGSAGVWALLSHAGAFPKFNRYYQLDDYLEDVEAAMQKSIPFSEELSSLAVTLKMAGGAKEFDNIFIGDDILVEDIGDPDQEQTEQNTENYAECAVCVYTHEYAEKYIACKRDYQHHQPFVGMSARLFIGAVHKKRQKEQNTPDITKRKNYFTRCFFFFGAVFLTRFFFFRIIFVHAVFGVFLFFVLGQFIFAHTVPLRLIQCIEHTILIRICQVLKSSKCIRIIGASIVFGLFSFVRVLYLPLISFVRVLYLPLISFVRVYISRLTAYVFYFYYFTPQICLIFSFFYDIFIGL